MRVTVIWVMLLCPAVVRADWPQFLGPQRNAVAADTGLNWDWKARAPKIAWKVPLGSGYSAFSIVGDKAFTLAQRGERDSAVCLSTHDGKELWHYDATATYVDVQKHCRGPRATPTYHQGKLYCLFAMGELVCLDADGKKLWEKNIFKETGATNPAGEFYYWGVSFSPLVVDDLVIVQPGGDKDNSVAAFHKDTGKLVWTAGSDPINYASPIAITVQGRRQIVCPTGSSILGLDPEKGKVLWRYPFGNKFKATCATPVWADNLLYVSAAYGVYGAALEIVGRTNGWEVLEKWKNKKSQNLMATSVILDGRVYGCHGDLSAWMLRCLDLKTGDILWEERAARRTAFLGVDGHLLALDELGNLFCLEATPKAYVPKGEMPKLLTYKSWAAPALANGRLYLRDEKSAVCVDLRK